MRSLLLAGLVCGLVWMTEGAATAEVTARREGRQVVFRAGTNEMFRYQAEPGDLPRTDIPEVYRRGGYLHPLLTPAGRQVTDDFAPNHLHHHGVWAPWTKTEFEGRQPDFWNMGDRKGRVEFVAVDRTWQDAAGAGLIARHRFVDLLAPEPRTVLNETWEVRAFVVDSPRRRFVVDLVSTQTCATASALRLPKYHYGGFGFRGNWAWNGRTNGLFLTSNGDTDRLKINETRAKWFWMGGPVVGGIAGAAVLSHPSNFRFPQPMRLHPDEPFFCFAPQQMGAMEIKPGEPYVARYRIVTADGALTKEELDRLWDSYAVGD